MNDPLSGLGKNRPARGRAMMREMRERLSLLLSTRGHSLTVAASRAELIAARIRLVAALLSLSILSWIGIDAFSLPESLAVTLALGHLAAAGGLAALVLAPANFGSRRHALPALCTLIAAPLSLQLYAGAVIAADPAGIAAAPIAYRASPVLVAALLGLFPLTILELTGLGLLPIAGAAAALLWDGDAVGALDGAMPGIVALAVLLAGLAGLSQLSLLLQLTDRAALDGLTGLLSRRVGQELIEHHFAYSVRHGTPLCVLFIDLDHFKHVNDEFGHDAGDDVLRRFGTNLRHTFRRQDILVRWGGEEMLVVMPGTDRAGADTGLKKLAAAGIGNRPDGMAITASIGIAERQADRASTAQALIALADRRMYQAKRAGQQSCADCDPSRIGACAGPIAADSKCL
jgi:diguanylate cyclase (GGDEF)-like protein